MIRRKFIAAGAACLLAATLPAMAQNYRAEYRLSTVLGTAFPWGQAGERWAELVKEKTQGRINIKLYPGTSLVGGVASPVLGMGDERRGRHIGLADDAVAPWARRRAAG